MKKKTEETIAKSVDIDMSNFFCDLFMSDYMDDINRATSEQTAKLIKSRFIGSDDDFADALFDMMDNYLVALGKKLGRGAFLSVFRHQIEK